MSQRVQREGQLSLKSTAKPTLAGVQQLCRPGPCCGKGDVITMSPDVVFEVPSL